MRLGDKVLTGSAPSVWDEEAAAYDRSRVSDPVYTSCIDITARAVPRGTGVCLDAGCGTGLSTSVLSRRCQRAIAVDYSFESLKVLRSKGLRNVLAVQADVTKLPFRDGVFDAAVCANTLQHLKPDGPQQQAVVELARATRTGGVISISVHHYSRQKEQAAWIKEGKPGQKGIDYIFRFTREELLRLQPRARVRGIGYYAAVRVPWSGRWLQRTLATLFGGAFGRLGIGHMLVAVSRGVPDR